MKARNPLRLDPTRTATLRRALASLIRKRYARLRGTILAEIAKRDGLGLARRPSVFSANVFCPTGPGGGVDPSCSPSGEGGSERENRSLGQKDFKEHGESNTQVSAHAAKNISDRWDVSDADLRKLAAEEGITKGTEKLEGEALKNSIARYLLNTWVSSSGGPLHTAIATAVAQQTGRSFELYQSQKETNEYIKNVPEVQRAVESFGKVMYENTQRWLADKGITEVTLYRTGLKDNPSASDRVFSSWATSEGGTRTEGNRVMVSAKIPAKDILSVPPTGFGSMAEAEVVVLPSPGRQYTRMRETLGYSFATNAPIDPSVTYATSEGKVKRDGLGLARKPAFSANVFCPTGVGGGVDPSCSRSEGPPSSSYEGKSIYHFTSPEAAEKIRSSGYVKENEGLEGIAAYFTESSAGTASRGKSSERVEFKIQPGAKIVELSTAIGRTDVNAWMRENASPKERDEYDVAGALRRNGIDAIRLSRKGGEEHWWLVANPDKFKLSDSPTANAAIDPSVTYATSDRKVERFRAWLREEMGSDLAGDRLIQHYIDTSYKKGAARSYDDLKSRTTSGRFRKRSSITKPSPISPHPAPLDYAHGSKEQFLRLHASKAPTVEKVKLLSGRVLTELEDVDSRMATKMTRILTDGLVSGASPEKIARAMVGEVDVEMTRALTIARTELVRAHAEGQLDALETLGVEEVTAVVEWVTAGDDRVCALCEPLEGAILSLDDARGMLPRHPNCRCAWVPHLLEEDLKPTAKHKAPTTNRPTGNVYRPTGPGGGVDPGCSPSSSTGRMAPPKDVIEAASRFKEVSAKLFNRGDSSSSHFIYQVGEGREIQVSYQVGFDPETGEVKHGVRIDFGVQMRDDKSVEKQMSAVSLKMVRKVRDATREYHRAGFQLLVAAADERRQALYTEALTRMGMTRSPHPFDKRVEVWNVEHLGDSPAMSQPTSSSQELTLLSRWLMSIQSKTEGSAP